MNEFEGKEKEKKKRIIRKFYRRLQGYGRWKTFLGTIASNDEKEGS